MNHEELVFKLKLRRWMLKIRNNSATLGVIRANYRNVPLELIDAVIAECLRDGTLTVSTGFRNCQVYTWHEEAVALEVPRG